MMEYEYAALEDEMIRFASHLLYETNLDHDAIRVRFMEMYGEENADLLEQILSDESN